MKNMKIFRKIFQFLAVILFIIQLEQSVRKYFKYPVVVQSSRVSVSELPAPIIYICNTDQFNYTEANNHGYRYLSWFLAGIKRNKKLILWTGNEENMTYIDLENLFFNYDYTSLYVGMKSETNGKWRYDHPLKKTFLLPHGICLKLENIQPWVRIWTSKKVTFFIRDPASENEIRIGETEDAQATVGPSSNNLYESTKFKVEYTLNDDSIHDGSTCIDYTRIATSYGECLKSTMEKEYQSEYECLPPWVSTNITNQVCKRETNIDAIAIKQKPIYSDLLELLGNKEADMFKKCLPPCITMMTKLKNIMYKTNVLGKADFEAKSNDWATVHKQVYSYDIFNLTVDLGSALGLWMGLSCISILDCILANLIKFKKFWKNMI